MKTLGLLFSAILLSTALSLFLFQKFFNKPAPPTQTVHYGDALVRVAEQSKSAVVFVQSANMAQIKGAPRPEEFKTGSGIIITQDGFVITNYHVISGHPDIELLVNEQYQYSARVVGVDSTHDIALLRIQATNLAFLPFGNSDSLHVGEQVLTVGNPNRLLSSVTSGIISGLDRDYTFPGNATKSFIQIDAPTSEGSSGGAIVNVHGELVGVTVGIVSTPGNREGFAFAIPSNLVNRIVNDLTKHGTLVKGSLGMSIRKVNQEIAAQSKLPEIYGIVVEALEAGGAADMAGIQSLDVLLYVNGSKINSVADFQDKWRSYYPGDQLDIIVNRLGVIDTVQMIIQKAKEE
jgi:S1-C subfamily serine protease